MFTGVHGTGYFHSDTTVRNRVSTSAGVSAAPGPVGVARSRCMQNAHSIVVRGALRLTWEDGPRLWHRSDGSPHASPRRAPGEAEARAVYVPGLGPRTNKLPSEGGWGESRKHGKTLVSDRSDGSLRTQPAYSLGGEGRGCMQRRGE